MIMKKFKNRHILFGVLTLVSIVIYLSTKESDTEINSHDTARQVFKEDYSLTPAASRVVENPLQQPAPIVKPVAKKDSIVEEFEKATDYRVLFESLLQKKSDSASLYAMHILTLCTKMRDIDFTAYPSSSTKQDEARHLMQSRCASFTEDELSSDRKFDAGRDPRFNGRYRDLRNKWFDSKLDSTERSKLVSEIFATEDPLLLQYMGGNLFYKTGANYPVFNKVEYKEPNARQVFGAAWTAAVCDGTNSQCGKNDPFVIEYCAIQGSCFDNRETVMADVVEIQFGESGKALYKQIYPALVEAIKTQNISAFTN